MTKKLFKTIHEELRTRVEKWREHEATGVQAVFNSRFQEICGCPVKAIDNTDGILRTDQLSLLLGYKRNAEFSKNRRNLFKSIGQELGYLNFMKQNSIELVKAIFISDEENAFLIPTFPLLKYLDKTIKWPKASSSIPTSLPNLIDDLEKDEEIILFPFPITESFRLEDVVELSKKLEKKFEEHYEATEENIVTIFEEWDTFVIPPGLNEEKRISSFLNFILNIDSDKVYLNPITRILNFYDEQIIVTNHIFSFMKKVKIGNYTEDQKRTLTGCQDRLMENIRRRREGTFYTPQEWVDEAHREIEKVLGVDWKEKYIVWDCSCGLANLTRGYKFSRLYLSTLHYEDIENIKRFGYNSEVPDRNKFVFDFLNDPISNLPQELQDDLKAGKPIVFLNNPPYATAGGTRKKDLVKENVCDTRTQKRMKAEGLGMAGQELFNQFIYQMAEISTPSKNVILCTFTKDNLLKTSTYSSIRNLLIKKHNFIYESGFLFNSGDFDSVSGGFQVLVSIFKKSKETEPLVENIQERDSRTFPVKIKRIENDTVVEEDSLLQSCEKNLMELSRDIVEKDRKNKEVASLKYFLDPSNKTCLVQNNFLGYTGSFGHGLGTSILSSEYYDGHGVRITKKNLFYTTIYFLSSSLGSTNVFPIILRDEMKDFINDSLIFSIFSQTSGQSSLRNIHIKNRVYNIYNEFFWMSRDEMIKLATQYNFQEMIDDIQNHGQSDRYVYELLQTIQLSPDAQEILDLAKQLVVDSFKYRQQCNVPLDLRGGKKVLPHLQAWDGGWYQIRKGILEKHMKTELDLFKEKFKKFGERLREGVYKFGFLR